jgi:hypothetical protein
MAIEFVVEDGTGLSTATSYAEIADFRQYWENRGVNYSAPDTTDDMIKVWLNLATQWADQNIRYSGLIFSDTQALLVPRVDWCDSRDRLLDGTVPVDLKYGIFEVAAARKATLPDQSISGQNLTSKRIGPVSKTFGGPSGGIASSDDVQTRYPAAFQYFNRISEPEGLYAVPR